MMYLLDTCVISDFIKGDAQTLFHIRRKSPDAIAISSISIMEITYGLLLNPANAQKIEPILNDFLKVIQIFSFDEDDAKRAGEIRCCLKKQGTPIGAYDVLLAGVALNRDRILVSSNTHEFERVKKLQLENWRV